MSSRPLLIFPCNGNAVEALDCLGTSFALLGFVDDAPGKQGRRAHGHGIYSREAFARWPEAAVLAVPGGPASYLGRAAVIASLGIQRDRFATVVHPTARVSPLARMGCNVLLMAGVVVTSNAVIGDHVCVLPNTVIHHDAIVADHVLVGSNVSIAGSVVVEEGAYVATGTSVMHGIRIGAHALVGLGSTVIRDVPPGATVAGNPARPLAPDGGLAQAQTKGTTCTSTGPRFS